MYQPFKKRATEYLQDGDAYLSSVTPDFLDAVLKPHADVGQLYDRLVEIVGTPGSGKTTLATIVKFGNAHRIATSGREYKPLFEFLQNIGMISATGDYPAYCFARMPMESTYREFWELPYSEEVRNRILYSFIQARTILSWLREVEGAVGGLDHIDLDVVPDSPGAIEACGATTISDLQQCAAQMERAIYSTAGMLMPPPELPPLILSRYEPFSVLKGLRIGGSSTAFGVILDDFHALHEAQRKAVNHIFTRRETIAISRWTLMRFDALQARAAIIAGMGDTPADVSRSREIVSIRLQDPAARAEFKRAAPKMADQQLAHVLIFARNGLTRLGPAVEVDPREAAAPDAAVEIRVSNQAFCEKHRIAPARLEQISNEIASVVQAQEQDVREAAIRILLERYVKRTPQAPLIELVDVDPSRPISAAQSVIQAARLQLMHKYDRPYYYGLEVIVNAANENAERFLRLCAPLIDALEAQLISGRGRKRLTAHFQHKLLRSLAANDRKEWTWPENDGVLRLTDIIGEICKKRTLEPTAPYAPGPNGVGIRAEQLDEVLRRQPESRLASILKYAVAYNALSVDTQRAKGKDWVVLRLSGMLCIYHGLPFGKGMFVDSVALRTLEQCADA